MGRKGKTKAKEPHKALRSVAKHPSMAWLPAFFVGFCVGLLIHFIPGMDRTLEKAKNQKSEEKKSAAVQEKKAPIMWRPYRK